MSISRKIHTARAILLQSPLYHGMSDEAFLKKLFRLSMGKELDLENPKTFNEKLQWLKLYDRNPLYTTLVDKAAVKHYVAEKIGEEYIIPTLGIWDRFSDIDFSSLPEQFVLKCTHDSGGLVICRDKEKVDWKKAGKRLEKCRKANYYYNCREWPYKDVKPRILAEEYMVDESGTELKDYKFFCFDGEPKAMFIASDRSNPKEETKFDFFDMDFQHLSFTNGHPNAKILPKKPQSFEKMKELAARLSAGIPQVRVDFYDINGKIYFGEMTFFHWSGLMPFSPAEWDKKMGDWIKLPEKKEVKA